MSNALTVGQKLWYVPAYRWGGEPRELEVTKIGRKYAYAGESWHERKVNLVSLRVSSDGHAECGRCYVDREEYELSKRTQAAWAELKSNLGSAWMMPAGMTMEKIQAIANLLEASEPPK